MKTLAFSGIGLALVVVGIVAALTRPASILAAGGCFTTSLGSEICAVVQHCDGLTCHYHLYTDSPPCRPSGSGPDCGMI